MATTKKEKERKKRIKPRNPYARALALPQYRTKIIAVEKHQASLARLKKSDVFLSEDD